MKDMQMPCVVLTSMNTFTTDPIYSVPVSMRRRSLCLCWSSVHDQYQTLYIWKQCTNKFWLVIRKVLIS